MSGVSVGKEAETPFVCTRCRDTEQLQNQRALLEKPLKGNTQSLSCSFFSLLALMKCRLCKNMNGTMQLIARSEMHRNTIRSQEQAGLGL